MVKIKEVKRWSWEDIRLMCIRNNWYDSGSCQEYERMFDIVRNNKPTKTNIYNVAMNILEHTSDEQTVENIMFYIANDVVKTFYEIEE